LHSASTEQSKNKYRRWVRPEVPPTSFWGRARIWFADHLLSCIVNYLAVLLFACKYCLKFKVATRFQPYSLRFLVVLFCLVNRPRPKPICAILCPIWHRRDHELRHRNHLIDGIVIARRKIVVYVTTLRVSSGSALKTLSNAISSRTPIRLISIRISTLL
jgi:hypothetical protein